MKNILLLSFLFVSVASDARRSFFTRENNMASAERQFGQQSVGFKENRGQLHDQNGHPRADILCYGSDGNVNYYLKKGGISYQLVTEVLQSSPRIKRKTEGYNIADGSTVVIQRIDINWLNANQEPVTTFSGEQPGYANYYATYAPDGITNVRKYDAVNYQNIYDGVDLKYYYNDAGGLEYDLTVNPGADAAAIKMEVNGSIAMSLDKYGAVVIETPTGTVIQGAPVVLQEGKRIAAQWVLANNVLSYAVGPYDHTKALIIDPVVVSYGSYFGGRQVAALQIEKDRHGNIYMSGYSNAIYVDIATTGAYQDTVRGVTDAFVAKFDETLSLQWCTYYGADSGDVATACGVDSAANVYISGSTYSPVGMATPGAHKTSCPTCDVNVNDGFIAKFSSAGTLLWSTYVGGDDNDGLSLCTVDREGNIYALGGTNSATGIATPGAYQTTMLPGGCPFISKFNSMGVQQWGTYYSSATSGQFDIYGMCHDESGNILLTGKTDKTDIATAGAYQSSFPGGYLNAFLTKFSSSGTRMWATYFGSSSAADSNASTIGMACAADIAGNIYLTGWTSATGLPVSPGVFQTTNAGEEDGLLAKFDNSGNCIWATYYGGSLSDEPSWVTVDSMGDIFVTGMTFSPTGLASADAHQAACDSCDGAFYGDAFLDIFDPSGSRRYGTYYGGSGQDGGFSCVVNSSGKTIYMLGLTTSKTGIATAGAATGACFSCSNWVAPFLVKLDYYGLTGSPIVAATGSVVVYPNPTEDKITIMNEQPSLIKVINAVGMNVRTAVNTNTLSLKNLPPGVYYLQLIDDNGQTFKTARVLKQ